MDMVVVIKMGDHTHGTYFLWVPIILILQYAHDAHLQACMQLLLYPQC